MKPTYRSFLEASSWLVAAMVLWFLSGDGSFLWWQPLMIWFGFMFLFVITERLGYSAWALPFVALLVIIGWLFLYRLGPIWAEQQFKGIMLGFFLYFLGLLIPFTEPKIYPLHAVVALGLLLFTLLFGVRIRGAKAWLDVGLFRFQPVELAKISITLSLAAFLGKRQETRQYWDWVLLGLVFLLLALQKDLGPGLLIFLVYCCLDLARSFSWLKFSLYLAGGLGGFFASLFFFPHLQSRIQAWLWPWDYLDTKGYQILQGLFALQAGGIMGRGVGLGLTDVIPAAHTDYVFVVIGEELGLLGTVALLLIYLALAFWGFVLLKRIENDSKRLMALGLILLFHIQIFLVLGGILRLVPFTGMTLPFVSFGSSSLVAQMWMLGMLTKLGGERL